MCRRLTPSFLCEISPLEGTLSLNTEQKEIPLALFANGVIIIPCLSAGLSGTLVKGISLGMRKPVS
jgi:hypothetical protein